VVRDYVEMRVREEEKAQAKQRALEHPESHQITPVSWVPKDGVAGYPLEGGDWTGAPVFDLETAREQQEWYGTMDAGVREFSAHWEAAQSSWNTARGLSDAFEHAGELAEEQGITGAMTGEHMKGVVARSPANQTGNLTTTIGGARPMGASGDLTVDQVFAQGGAQGLDKHIQKDTRFDDTVDAFTGEAQRKLNKAIREAASGALTYENALVSWGEAFAGLNIAKQQSELDGWTAKEHQLKFDKAQVKKDIGAISKLFGVVESFARKGVGGLVELATADGLGSAVQYFVGRDFDRDLREVQVKIEASTAIMDKYKEEVAFDELRKAKNEVKKAENALPALKGEVVQAEQERRKALENLADTAKTKARDGGADQTEQQRIESLVKALPAVEMVCTRLQAILHCVPPYYNERSGLGFAVTNFKTKMTMKLHVAGLHEARSHYGALFPRWEARRTQIVAFIKGLHT
jgi:hypothetical protein